MPPLPPVIPPPNECELPAVPPVAEIELTVVVVPAEPNAPAALIVTVIVWFGVTEMTPPAYPPPPPPPPA
jgi:hypothetical protein